MLFLVKLNPLTTSRVQSNLPTVFIFVSEEKGYYRVVSVGQLSFDCRSYCGRSRRMQGLSYIDSLACLPTKNRKQWKLVHAFVQPDSNMGEGLGDSKATGVVELTYIGTFNLSQTFLSV